MADRAYFDWNATAPLRPESRAAVLAALSHVGNASSVHADGRAARRLVEDARASVAALVGADARNVVFTASGTEANNLALTPSIAVGSQKTCDRLIVSAIEHPSVRAGHRFPADRVEELPVTAAGVIDLAALRAQMARGARPLVSVMLANNETGVVQPIHEVAEIVHEAGGLLHVDAVQAVGRIECDINDLGADLLTLSSHKIGGPQGAGALVVRDAALHIAEPLIRGGGQERGQRAGTENVAAIAGVGAAAKAARQALSTETPRMAALRERVERGLRATMPEVVIFGEESRRLPNTTLFAVPGLKAETAIIAFDLEGVSVSSGAACSSGKVAASHVLAAMDVEPRFAAGAVRVSLGWDTQEGDLERLQNAWIKVSASLLKQRGIAA
ncbi:MAG TPA: cysteine desulfurase family protein [Pseudolabrys sp.]|nr:cysteine desulfurase family protein [Pseudolabrys sp.]